MVMSGGAGSGTGSTCATPDRNSMALAFGRARAQLLCPCRLADSERIESASERGARLCSCALYARRAEAEPSAGPNPARAAAPPRRRFLFLRIRLGGERW